MKFWKDGTDCSMPLREEDEDPFVRIGGRLMLLLPLGCGLGIFQS